MAFPSLLTTLAITAGFTVERQFCERSTSFKLTFSLRTSKVCSAWLAVILQSTRLAVSRLSTAAAMWALGTLDKGAALRRRCLTEEEGVAREAKRGSRWRAPRLQWVNSSLVRLCSGSCWN